MVTGYEGVFLFLCYPRCVSGELYVVGFAPGVLVNLTGEAVGFPEMIYEHHLVVVEGDRVVVIVGFAGTNKWLGAFVTPQDPSGLVCFRVDDIALCVDPDPESRPVAAVR